MFEPAMPPAVDVFEEVMSGSEEELPEAMAGGKKDKRKRKR